MEFLPDGGLDWPAMVCLLMTHSGHGQPNGAALEQVPPDLGRRHKKPRLTVIEGEAS